MIPNITENDLILYYYHESSAEVTKFINDQLESQPSWSKFLKKLDLIRSASSSFSPSNTSISIILEESIQKETHSHSI